MAPSKTPFIVFAAVMASFWAGAPIVRAQPFCARQTGLGQQYIYSSLSLGTDITPYNAGPIYVDETRELLFTSWNGGVYMLPVTLNASSYAPIFKCPQTQLIQLTIANANVTQMKLGLDTARGILFAGGETGGNASSPVWYAIEYTVLPPNITTITMNGTGNFTGAGSGAPKTIDYDSVKNFLISSVDMAPAVVMNLTILRSDPPTWIMGTKPSANSTSGVNFSGAVLDVTRRKGYFAGQQGPDGPSYGSINVRIVNLDYVLNPLYWTSIFGSDNLIQGVPKNYARLDVATDPGTNVYVTGRFLPDSDTSAWGNLSYVWSFAPTNTRPFDQFNLFPSPKDRMISLSVNAKTQRAYFVTDAQSNSLALYPSTYRVSYISAFKGKNFTEISGTPGKVGSIQGPMWFSPTVDIGFAWHDSLASPSGLDLVAFSPTTCPGGYLTCDYLSTLCSCRLNNTPTSPLISLSPQIGLTPCFGSSQSSSNVSLKYPTCLVPSPPPPPVKYSPPPAKTPPSKVSPPSAFPPPAHPPPSKLSPPPALPPPANPPPSETSPPPVLPPPGNPPPFSQPPPNDYPPPESAIPPPSQNGVPQPPPDLCPPPPDLLFPPPYGTFFGAQPPPDDFSPPLSGPPESAPPPSPSPNPSPNPSPSPSPSPTVPQVPMPSPAPPLSCGGQLAADTCAGGSEELSFQFSIEGLAVDASGVTTTVTAGQPIEVRSLAFGSGMLPVQARESVSLDAYVSGASLLLTQASANVGSSSLFFKPETGSVSFAVSEQPPPGYVFAVEAFQAVDCSPEDAWQSSVNNTFGTCTWLHASLGRYARYDPLTSSASAAYHSASDWGSLFVLHLSPVQDWVVPFSVTIVDPTNATDIEGSAGGPEVGGVFRFSASVNGTENVTATAAYYPGEAHPMNARVGSSNGRALLATAEPDYVTTTVASAMLHLSQGGNVYAPINGSFSFSDVSSKSGDRFFVRAFSYSDCDPADISKLSTFVNCTWQEVADQSVTLSIDAANQRATLGNLGGTWNTLHVLSRVSVATRPRAPPAGGDVAGAAVGMGAQAILIVLAVVAGLFLVIGLPLVAMHRGALMGALSRRRERPVRGDGHSA